MALQDRVDAITGTDEERKLKSFVVRGEQGDCEIPEFCHARLYDCKVGKLTLKGSNFVFMEGGSVSSGISSAAGSKLLARDTAFEGDADLTETDVDLFRVSSKGSWILKAKSFLRADRSTFTQAAIALDSREGSHARITRSTFANHSTSAVKADAGSYVVLSKCDSVKATQTVIHAKEGSVVEAYECKTIEASGGSAVKAEISGRVTLRACETVKGSVDAIVGESNGYVVADKCQKVTGSGGAAVKLSGGAGADVRMFDELVGSGASALALSDEAYAVVASGTKIASSAKDAVELGEGCDADILSVATIEGSGRDAVSLGKGSSMMISGVTKKLVGSGRNVGTVTGGKLILRAISPTDGFSGSGGMGFDVTEGGKLAMYDCSAFSGSSGHGISAKEGSKVTLRNVVGVTGSGGDGVALSDDSSLVAVGGTHLTGSSGHGISMKDGCRALVTRYARIVGSSGCGVKVDDGGTVGLSKVDQVTGSSSHGIEAEDAVIRLDAVGTITGSSGNGIDLTNSLLRMVRCGTVQGSSGAGIKAQGRGPQQDRMELYDSPMVSGSDVGFDLDGYLAITQGCQVSGTTALKLSNCHLRSTRDQFSGDAEVEDSIVENHQSRITGKSEINNSAVHDAGGSWGYEIDMEGSGMVSAKGTFPQGSSSASGFVGAKATVGSIELDGDGFGMFGGAGASSLSGAGSVVEAAAGGNPQDGLDYVAVESDAVRVQNKDVSYALIDGDTITNESSTGSKTVLETDLTETIQGSIEITAQQSYSCTAQTTWEATGQSTATLTGQGSCTVTSSGITTIEGSVVYVQ